MEKIIFISVVRDFEMYNRIFEKNPYVIKDEVILTLIDNSVENIGISKRYNNFLEKFDYSNPSWMVFCHEDWDILESISKKIMDLDKDSLYGSFGARIVKKNDTLVREYIGDIYDCTKEGDNLRKIGKKYDNLTEVDALDCQSLIVHSSLIEKFNLRFDENLEWDLYVEDFCMNAFVKHQIRSKVLNLEVCHWSQVQDIKERPTYMEKYPYINDKYKKFTFAGIVNNVGNNVDKILSNVLDVRIAGDENRSRIYQTNVFSENDARHITVNYIKSGKKILDVGCACGDFAVALKIKKEVEIWGMEYNQGSIDIAKRTRMFEKIYKIDLNDFNADEFRDFFDFFDYIIFGDVLEHINFPQKTLELFKSFLKSDGEFLLSIPNISHASIKSNLLIDDFTYMPYGLLDETHVKFFTHKSIPSFLADIDLEIEENKITFQDKIGCQSTNPYNELPVAVKRFIFEDFYSYVLQYVIRVKKSSLDKNEIKKINDNKLFVGEKNSPNGLLELRLNDLSSLKNETEDEIFDLKNKLNHLKSSKFWKLRNEYVYLKNGLKFVFLSPKKFIKKYIIK